jgi:hypothetical protein
MWTTFLQVSGYRMNALMTLGRPFESDPPHRFCVAFDWPTRP